MNSRTITVAQQKGGSGKTTLAINIGVTLHQKGYKVALVDIDPQGSMVKWFDIRKEKFGEEFTGVKLFTGIGWKISSDLSTLRRKYDFIIIDNPPHAETNTKTTIKEADLVILPCQPTLLDIWALDNTISLCQKENIEFIVVPNRVNANSKNFKELFSNVPNVSENIIGNRVAMSNYLKEGKSVTELEPNSTAATEIKAMVAQIEKIFISEEELEFTN